MRRNGLAFASFTLSIEFNPGRHKHFPFIKCIGVHFDRFWLRFAVRFESWGWPGWSVAPRMSAPLFSLQFQDILVQHKITLGQMLLNFLDFFNSVPWAQFQDQNLFDRGIVLNSQKKWNCAQFPGIELKGFWFPLGTEHNSRWNCGWELSSRDGIVVGNWAQGME